MKYILLMKCTLNSPLASKALSEMDQQFAESYLLIILIYG